MTDAFDNIGATLARRSGAEQGLTGLQPHLDRADRVVQAASLEVLGRRNNLVVQTQGAPAPANTTRSQQIKQALRPVQEPMVGRRLPHAPGTEPQRASLSSRSTTFEASSTAPRLLATPPGTASLSTHAPAAAQDRLKANARAPRDHLALQPPTQPSQGGLHAPQPTVQQHIAPPYSANLAQANLSDAQPVIASPPPQPFAPIDDAAHSQTAGPGKTEPQLDPAQLPSGQGASHASSRWRPSGQNDQYSTSRSTQMDHTEESEGQSEGRLIFDSALLGRWVIDHISHAADRPATGSTAFDPRISQTWPGALQSL